MGSSTSRSSGDNSSTWRPAASSARRGPCSPSDGRARARAIWSSRWVTRRWIVGDCVAYSLARRARSGMHVVRYPPLRPRSRRMRTLSLTGSPACISTRSNARSGSVISLSRITWNPSFS